MGLHIALREMGVSAATSSLRERVVYRLIAARVPIPRAESTMTKSSVTIYHNPRCGKSRSTLALLEEKGAQLHIIEYLKAPPTKEELRSILKKLGMKPAQIVRKGEEVFKERFAGKTLRTNNCWTRWRRTRS